VASFLDIQGEAGPANLTVIHAGCSPDDLGEDVEVLVRRLGQRKRSRETRLDRSNAKDNKRAKWCH
jgi:hypothetical protein